MQSSAGYLRACSQARKRVACLVYIRCGKRTCILLNSLKFPKRKCLKANLETVDLFSPFVSQDCKFPMAIQDSSNRRSCNSNPLPALLTSANDKERSYLVCSELASREVISCDVSKSNSWCLNNGRWKQMWGLYSRGKSSSGSEANLETILQKVFSKSMCSHLNAASCTRELKAMLHETIRNDDF